MFNAKGMTNKQINAAAVIFSLLNLSLVGIITGQAETICVVVLVYSLICLFSYLNLTYVRDFDACQVNAVPAVLAVITLISVMKKGANYVTCGIFVSLALDSYFGLRYEENTDSIHLTPFEMLARESWTELSFDLKHNLPH